MQSNFIFPLVLIAIGSLINSYLINELNIYRKDMAEQVKVLEQKIDKLQSNTVKPVCDESRNEMHKKLYGKPIAEGDCK